MANNPETYDARVEFKNAFSELSSCRRVALRVLPVDFFIHFYRNLIIRIKTDLNYRMILDQFKICRSNRYQQTTLYQQAEEDAIDTTMETFNDTLNELNVTAIGVDAVYRNFLKNCPYALACLSYTLKHFN